MDALRGLVTSGQTARDEFPELMLGERGPLLGRVIWLIIVGAAIFLLVILDTPMQTASRVTVAVGLMALAVSAKAMHHFRGTVATLRLLAIGGWLLATASVLAGEGVRSVILVVYPVILIVAGWTLGARYCLGLLAASCIALVLMALSQQSGRLDVALTLTPIMVAFVHVMVLVISAVLSLYLLKLFRTRYAEVTHLNQQVRSQLELSEMREGFQRTLLDNFPFMVWLKDEKGRYLAVNQAFLDGFGRPSADAVVGKTDLDLAAASLADEYRVAGLTVFGSSSRKPVEELIDIGGQWRWCETSRSPVRVGDKVVGMVGYARDITDRREIEAQIVESRSLLRAVIDNVPVRVYWKDRNLTYLGCNQAFARDAGMSAARDVIGKDDYQLAWAEQAEAHRADDRAVMVSALPRLAREEERRTADGIVKRLRLSKVPLRDSNDEIIGVLGMYEDITDEEIAARTVGSTCKESSPG